MRQATAYGTVDAAASRNKSRRCRVNVWLTPCGVGQTLIRHLVGGDVMLCWRMSTHNATVTTGILGNNGWSNLLKILCFQLNINFMQAFLVSGVITDSLYSKTTVTCLTIMLLWWMKDSSYIFSNSNLKSLSNVTWYLFVFNFNIIDL